MAKAIGKKTKRSPLIDFFKLAIFTLLLVYAVGTIISTQADIAEQKATIERLKADILETHQENDEYLRILGSTDEQRYMFNVAVERFGYAYPLETRFYVKQSGK